MSPAPPDRPLDAHLEGNVDGTAYALLALQATFLGEANRDLWLRFGDAQAIVAAWRTPSNRLAEIGNAARRIAFLASTLAADALLRRPPVVVLCGSTTKARDAFPEWYGKLTDRGEIVLSVGRLAPVSGWDEETKQKLDELHLRKIDLADYVFVLNVGGYVGDSTRREIHYATLAGKPVRYLEPI